MDDLAATIGSVLSPQQSYKIPPAVQASRDVDRLKILQDERAKATNSADDNAALDREISRVNGVKPAKAQNSAPAQASMQDPFGDLASTVGSALTEAPAAAPAPVLTPKRPSATPAEQPGGIMSALAGAGKATGTGVLALQQLAGKGLEFAGDALHQKSTRELIVPLKKGWDENKNWAQNLGAWLRDDATEGVQKLQSENAPYEEANPKANFGGEVAGMVLSPLNKLVPGGGGASVLSTLGRGAVTGGTLNALATPVTNEDQPYLTEKAKQFAAGMIGGTVGSGLSTALSAGINKGITALRNAGTRLVAGDSAKVADDVVEKTLNGLGIPPGAAPQGLRDGLKAQVQEAVKRSGKVDEAALTRLTQAQTLPVPVPMLQGQISRDAMEFAKEQNLRGIKGKGEPITETLVAQNRALIQNLDAIGASGGADIVSAGKGAIDTLVRADAKLKEGVTAAYDAFKNHTGKELDVPLQGIAQDYAATVKSFGDAIPSAVRRQFESLGLMSGKQTKTFSISDAESLLKDINRNYDPMKRAEAHALDDLRQSVQKAIYEGAGDGAGGEAAKLAQSARAAARARFSLIDSTPALKDAIAGVEPDRFIQRHILQGNTGQIKNLVSVLGKEDPAALQALQSSVMAHIKSRVINKNSDANGIFSQAQLKQFVSDPNMSSRLTEVLGKDRMTTLRQLNQVAEDALYAPKASAVNTSNTASAGANLVQEAVKGGGWNNAYDLLGKVPGLRATANDLRAENQAQRAADLVNQAVNPSLTKPAARTRADLLLDFGKKETKNFAPRAGAASVSSQNQQQGQR